MKTIFIPRFTDSQNTNAQNQNAIQLLKLFDQNQWKAVNYYSPDQELLEKQNVQITQLNSGRLWASSLIRHYLSNYSAVFYPGKEWYDIVGLKLRQILGRRGPVISTIEGVMGGHEREQQLSTYFNHPVYCNNVEISRQNNFDALYRYSDSIIAISPFLKKVTEIVYKKHAIYLPLGISKAFYYRRTPAHRNIVLCVGSLNYNKNPRLFVEAAEKFPAANFVWYGDGPLLSSLKQSCVDRKLTNINFYGKIPHKKLIECYRQASIFVLPSFSEGAPKVLQEAAAASLPLVSFGYYESPSLRHNENGIVVWNDQGFFEAIDKLLCFDKQYVRMCERSYELSLDWEWSKIAPQWLNTLESLIESHQ